ncbi:MAG: stage III sporulation protein AA [Candidatus Limivivens sp.]|nr:stage III sporulation protein AA [Candidatus Limivivens sp.]
MEKDEFLKIFSMEIRSVLKRIPVDYEDIQEIRLRACQPMLVVCGGREYFVTEEGVLTEDEQKGYQISKEELMATMEYIGNYSLYAYEEELKQGFLTVKGGHRVGVAGKIVMEGNRIQSIKYISFLNVRLAHQKKGCADSILPYLFRNGQICHTLIISPPRCGKTTILRDLIRQISNGSSYCQGQTVGVVDERSEIGGSYLGIPQNDLGIRTDVLDCCPKALGMMMLLRSMSPAVIAVDELGDYNDIHAIESVIHCGCHLLATVHGSSIEDIKRKPLLQKLVTERFFERYILLWNQEKIGEIKGIFDERGTALYRSGGMSC